MMSMICKHFLFQKHYFISENSVKDSKYNILLLLLLSSSGEIAENKQTNKKADYSKKSLFQEHVKNTLYPKDAY